MILYRQDRYIHFPVEIWLHFLDRIGPNPLQMNSYWLQTTKCHILGLEDLNDWYISFHLDQPDNCSTDLRTTIFRRQNHTDHCHNSADYYFLIELLLAILKSFEILWVVPKKVVHLCWRTNSKVLPEAKNGGCVSMMWNITAKIIPINVPNANVYLGSWRIKYFNLLLFVFIVGFDDYQYVI